MIGLKDEIANYLELECEESNCNPLEYWKSNSSKFPSLSQMSKDFLGVQSSTGLAYSSCMKFNQLLDSYTSAAERSAHHYHQHPDPSQSPSHSNNLYEHSNSHHLDPAHHHHHHSSPAAAAQHFMSSSAEYGSAGQIHEAHHNMRAASGHNPPNNLLSSSAFPAALQSTNATDRMGTFIGGSHAFQLHSAGNHHHHQHSSNSHNNNNNAHEKDIIVSETPAPALPLLCPTSHPVGAGGTSSSSGGPATPLLLLPPPPPSQTTTTTTPAAHLPPLPAPVLASGLDLLDAYGPTHPLFAAAEASVCLQNWAFVNAFLDL
jgi:hypothetical protein